jgi:hypothetical protein
LYERVIDWQATRLPPFHPQRARSYHEFARLLSLVGGTVEAMEWYQRALQIRLEQLGEGHPKTIETRAQIALLR